MGLDSIRTAPTRLGALLVAVLLLSAVASPLHASQEGSAATDTAAELYREGAREAAADAWRARLDARVDGPHERARLAYNLGVAAHAEGDPLLAAAWFEAALRLDPGHADALHNLEIARADAGAAPRSSGDITSAALALLRRVEPAHADWLALAGALLVLATGLAWSLRGGGGMRTAFVAAVLFQPVAWAPLVRHAVTSGGDPVMIVAEGKGARVRASPDASAETLTRLAPGVVTERVEEYRGWTKVVARGEERWVEPGAAFPLSR